MKIGDYSLKFFLLIFFGLTVFSSLAQTVPNGFSFQSVVRGADGRLLKSENVKLVFSLRPGQGDNTVWQETKDLITDEYGIVTHIIGEGTVNQIGTGPVSFKEVRFEQGGYWLKVTLNNANGEIISDQALQAVPYARYAQYSPSAFPVGFILPFAGDLTKIPSGWLLCDGRSLNADDVDPQSGKSFNELYEVIKTNWGGTGANSFNLPDLQGQFLRGVDGNANIDPDKAASTNNGVDGKRYARKTNGNIGNTVGSYQNESFKEHTHIQTWEPPVSGGNGGWTYPNGAAWGNGTSADKYVTRPAGGLETRPSNAYVYYLIKF